MNDFCCDFLICVFCVSRVMRKIPNAKQKKVCRFSKAQNADSLTEKERTHFWYLVSLEQGL